MDEISILYPSPPPFFKLFTKENIERLNKLKENLKAEELRENEEVLSSNLKYLLPPAIPTQDVYHSFGNVWQFKDKFMNLADAGIPQLYPDSTTMNDDEEDIFTSERIQELKKLTKSLLLNFLELVGLLVKNPYYINSKIEHTRIILINLHHLLNSYRLHQSREDLILKIEDKISATLEEVDQIETTVLAIEQKFKTLTERIDSVDDLKINQGETELSPIPIDSDQREVLIKQILNE